VRLLDRTTRRVTLTAVGRDFARKTRVWLDDLDGMLMGLGDVAARRMGEVTIACVPSAVYYFLPQVVKRYHERFPKIRVKVHDASANEVLVAVAQGDADFGLNFIGRQEAEIEFKPVLAERFVAACRRGHVLARRKKVSWAELGQHDFMSVGKTSGNRLLMDLALANVPDRPQCLYEAKHVTTLLGLVEAGLGVAAVPSLAMPGKDHPTLVSIPLVEPIVSRQMGLIKRRGKTLSPAAQQLYDLLVATRSVRPRKATAA
jgi:DNA-binding transcriptional LysR family regulator